MCARDHRSLPSNKRHASAAEEDVEEALPLSIPPRFVHSSATVAAKTCDHFDEDDDECLYSSSTTMKSTRIGRKNTLRWYASSDHEIRGETNLNG
ncbi:hypothetical protein GUJ93_ZPchr0006g44415 [Zizania palustris]|uniref:Uncharacterized protein n=1 Tax=Zizania palustris TaxID=103762 RepID=A0A8J5SYT5_ZIZPA|nr:hypothetical protein GUJ93_ZPchr0006g44415 [Zizania palustris]